MINCYQKRFSKLILSNSACKRVLRNAANAIFKKKYAVGTYGGVSHKTPHWYNEDHRHSGIRFVTPGQRYRGEDIKLLNKRNEVYQIAKAKHPNRWSGHTRNWQPINSVALNPEKEVLLAA